MNRIRNPFGKKPPTVNGYTTESNENQRPSQLSDAASQRSSFAGSRASSSLSIAKKNEEPNEYKLSVVNDSGVYLPPSPPEKKGFWPKATQLNGGKSNHRSMLNENEPFSISRESFESYRRSFDISARSPILQQSEFTSPRPSMGSPRPSFDTRKSLDSRQSLDTNTKPRSAIKQQHDSPPKAPKPTIGETAAEQEQDQEGEERFEDVTLGDNTTDTSKAPHRKKGFLSRFGDNSPEVAGGGGDVGAGGRPTSSHRGFHLPGRKRGQSGQGAELGNIEGVGPKGENDGVVK